MRGQGPRIASISVVVGNAHMQDAADLLGRTLRKALGFLAGDTELDELVGMIKTVHDNLLLSRGMRPDDRRKSPAYNSAYSFSL